jgi:D-alanyl-D-alanine carboxypeptidase
VTKTTDTESDLARGPRRRLPAAGVLVAAVTLAGAAPARDGVGVELGRLGDRVVAEGAPGVLVAVRENGRVRTTTRGVADRERSLPMRADARFRIGSVTKTFVAALVLRLVEDGRLRLDDSVERWLPGLVPGGRSVTVRQLLSHRSGLADYVDDPRLQRRSARQWQPRQLVSIAASRPGGSAPGTRYAYSNTNYVVLGLLAERVGGAPLGRLLRDRLLVPLGLDHTSFAPGPLGADHVKGYRPPSHQGIVTGRPVREADAAWWAWAAGGIVSSAGDLQRFFAALLRGRALEPRSLSQMERLRPAGRLRYGLGIATFPTPCGPAWGHTGNVQGTVTVAWNRRDASRQVVVVVNAYPLSGELEAAVRRLQLEAFCGPA